ncbi:rab-like protein 2B [Crotalus tigris]|uniref:rab-like protein 2B n=1 Tax=Crotalus tigris TaxID=88082 RepID=UPI00192F5ED4|nr:rab-like protein 2B [Crotalus tigris]
MPLHTFARLLHAWNSLPPVHNGFASGSRKREATDPVAHLPALSRLCEGKGTPFARFFLPAPVCKEKQEARGSNCVTFAHLASPSGLRRSRCTLLHASFHSCRLSPPSPSPPVCKGKQEARGSNCAAFAHLASPCGLRGEAGRLHTFALPPCPALQREARGGTRDTFAPPARLCRGRGRTFARPPPPPAWPGESRQRRGGERAAALSRAPRGRAPHPAGRPAAEPASPGRGRGRQGSGGRGPRAQAWRGGRRLPGPPSPSARSLASRRMAKPGGPQGEPPLAGLDQDKYDAEENVKIICLGDSAVGKSKLMERFLMEGFKPQQLSTFALTLYKHTATVDGKMVLVDFWDTAGQERFQSMHPSYYHKAHACIMVFDVQRKLTYKNLANWYKELREFRPQIPCIVVANKIDADLKATQKSFNFAKKLNLPLYFVSAADGTNVVKLFTDAIKLAVAYKQNSEDFMDEVLKELENFDLETKEEDSPTEESSPGKASWVHLSPGNE